MTGENITREQFYIKPMDSQCVFFFPQKPFLISFSYVGKKKSYRKNISGFHFDSVVRLLEGIYLYKKVAFNIDKRCKSVFFF